MSAHLFTEDRCNTSSEDETAACDAEVTLINDRMTPTRATTVPFSPGRPMSTPTTTQGDSNQVASPTPLKVQQQNNENQYIDTNNYFVPDGSDRRIHDIQDKVFHAGYLENGNNAYLLRLPKLQDMLHTSQFLMDETSGQFYAIYGNTYQKLSTKPMLKEKWGQGELIDQLAATRQAFGYAGLSGSTPCLQHSSPVKDEKDDFISEKLAPKTVQYQLPSFSLDRPTAHLTIEERVQVHHNYISAVSNLEHKKNLINKLKRSDPQNIDAYEAEMRRHMALHDDVLGRILTILKQDDYYRTLEELPTIDSLRAYDDIKLFPELYDTITIIERVTSEADLIERQL